MDPIEGKEEVESQASDQPQESVGETKKSKKSKKDKKSKKSRSRRSTISKEPSSTSLESKENKEPKPFNIRDTLTPEQIEILDAMKQQIEPELKSNYERKWCSEMCYVRYLKAREWDLKKASNLLRGTLEWRRTYKPHMITAEDVLIELKNEGKMYRNGKDKTGRPIIYMKPAKDNTGVPEKDVKVKYLVYLMEKATASCDESKGVDKIIWLIDFKGHGALSGISNTKISKEILDILQDHYPERLGIGFICNPPWVFSVFWKTTKQKVRMINSKNFDEILEHIDEEQLEEEYGGKNTFKYNFDEHWKKEDNEHPPITTED